MRSHWCDLVMCAHAKYQHQLLYHFSMFVFTDLFVCCIAHLSFYLSLRCSIVQNIVYIWVYSEETNTSTLCVHCCQEEKKTKLNLCMLYNMRCVNLSNTNARILLTLSIFVTVVSAWQMVIYSFVQDIRLEDFCELIKGNSMTVLYGTVSFRSKQMPATQYKLPEWWMQSINFTCRDEIDCTRNETRSEMLNEKLADGNSHNLDLCYSSSLGLQNVENNRTLLSIYDGLSQLDNSESTHMHTETYTYGSDTTPSLHGI